MIKIKLFCCAGMSTGMLVDKMKAAAKNKGIEADIKACPEAELPNCLDDLDVALLGPQVQYRLKEDKEICEKAGVAIDVETMVDYGTMNGEKVLQFALDLKK